MNAQKKIDTILTKKNCPRKKTDDKKLATTYWKTKKDNFNENIDWHVDEFFFYLKINLFCVYLKFKQTIL